MALEIYKSTSVDVLVKKVADFIKNNNNIFLSEFIVTDNSSINEWFKIKVAEENGIVANLKFISNDDIADIINSIVNPGNKASLLSTTELQWEVYEALSYESFKKKEEKISEYYKDNQLKQYQLSKKVANLLDDYQLYLTEEDIESKGEWQNSIWDIVKKNIEKQEKHNTRFDFLQKIKTDLEITDNQKLLKEKLPVLHLFLGSDFSKFHLGLLHFAKEYIDIKIYQHSTNAEDEDTWDIGKNDKIEKLLDEDKKVENYNKTLLEYIQQEKQQEVDVNIKNDGSFLINSSYTPTREVEVLYNYLVKTIDDSKNTIGARDILVLAPNIDLYAPAIKGIFDLAPLSIPYSISDSTYSPTTSVLSVIEHILKLDDKFKAEDVFSLLEFNQVKTRFEIDDISKLRAIVDLANIRVGFNGEEENETNTVSWKHGIKKLFYGYCIATENKYSVDDENMLLRDLTEGKEIYDIVKLNNFIYALNEVITDRKDKSLKEWSEYLQKTCESLFITTDDDKSALNRIFYYINKVSDIANSKIDYSVYLNYVLDVISAEKRKSKFASKGITFCSINEKKSLPYKVIAVLGLNNNEFPSKETSLSYDLLTKIENNKPTKEEKDRSTFSKVLLSAKEKMYLSYIGKSVKSNSDLSPSPVIDTLLDNINDTTNIKIDEFIIQHPLHNFDLKYNNKNDKYYNYLNVENKNKELLFVDNKKEPYSTITEIDLDDFIKFFKNPIKYYLNNNLGIKYYDNDYTLRSNELFDLDGLDKWKIKQQLLRGDVHREGLVEKGMLQLSKLGEAELKNIEENVKVYSELFEKETKDYINKIENINLELKEATINGSINEIYEKEGKDGKFVFVSFSSEGGNVKYMLEFYIKQLVLITLRKRIKSKFIVNIKSFKDMYSVEERSGVHSTNLSYFKAEISPETAKEELNKLVYLYKKGQERMLVFSTELNLINTAYKEFSEKDYEKVTKRIKKAITPGDHNYTSKELRQVYNEGFFKTEIKIKELGDNTKAILSNVFNK